MSDSEMSALFPRLTNLEKPMFRPMAQSSTAVQSAPDWEKKEMKPFGGVPRENDAFSEACVLIRPRQLGPSTRTPADARRLAQGSFEGDPRPPDLLESGGDDDPRAHPLRREPGDPFEDGARRDDEDAQVDGPGDRVDGRVQRVA